MPGFHPTGPRRPDQCPFASSGQTIARPRLAPLTPAGVARKSPQMSQTVAPWILSEGLAGLQAQALGLAEASGLVPDVRVLQPRAPWKWIAARLWPRPLSVVAGSLRAPLPDLVIGCGGMAAAVIVAFLAEPRPVR